MSSGAIALGTWQRLLDVRIRYNLDWESWSDAREVGWIHGSDDIGESHSLRWGMRHGGHVYGKSITRVSIKEMEVERLSPILPAEAFGRLL